MVDVVHRALVAAVHEQVVHDAGEFVAGRPVYGPVGWELFVRPENLFDHQVHRAPAGVGSRAAEIGRPRLQPPQVVAGREQAVDVIDPQPGRRAAREQLQHEPVHLVEDHGVFNSHGGKLIDVEETPVVDFLGRDVPVGQPV